MGRPADTHSLPPAVRGSGTRYLGISSECIPLVDPIGQAEREWYIESFNGKFRDECLNALWFLTTAQAGRIMEDSKIEYNTERPHGSLADLTPRNLRKQFWLEGRERVSLSTADSTSGSDQIGCQAAITPPMSVRNR